MRPLEGGGGAKSTAGLNVAGEGLLQSGAEWRRPCHASWSRCRPSLPPSRRNRRLVVDSALAGAGGSLALKGVLRERACRLRCRRRPLPCRGGRRRCLGAAAQAWGRPAAARRHRARPEPNLDGAFAAKNASGRRRLAVRRPAGRRTGQEQRCRPKCKIILDLINRVDRRRARRAPRGAAQERPHAGLSAASATSTRRASACRSRSAPFAMR
jgi:hypothetical protein